MTTYNYNNDYKKVMAYKLIHCIIPARLPNGIQWLASWLERLKYI